MILLAHHVELQHVPVLALFMAVGGWLGWHATALALSYLRAPENQQRDLSR